MAAHPHADDADLRDARVVDQIGEADRAARLVQRLDRSRQIGGGDGEGHVRRARRSRALVRDILDDHVD
ncbi:hypothetical protein LTR94_038786, partial [Friedmanniomyces endolithicus]